VDIHARWRRPLAQEAANEAPQPSPPEPDTDK
jgi:hypothetical protein